MQYQVEILRSKRKTLAVQVVSSEKVLVRAPRYLSAAAVDAFLRDQAGWIALHLEMAKAREKEKRAAAPLSPEELACLSRQAAAIMAALCARHAAQMGVAYQRITIRRQKTRWGSCSQKGRLNFNCLLALCPKPVQEYVAVHELCHLKEMNHSPRFWQEVQKALPGYEASRRWLKAEGRKLMDRLP